MPKAYFENLRLNFNITRNSQLLHKLLSNQILIRFQKILSENARG